MVLVLINTKTIYCQNLILNPSFEDSVASPLTFEEIDNSLYWKNPNTASPDYFHISASSAMAMTIPYNFFGYQYSRMGNAHGGIYGAGQSTSGGPLDGREYIQGQFSDTLIAGNVYHVSFYFNFSNNSNVAITKLGAYISSAQISLASFSNFPYTPQIVTPAGTYLTDTLNWVLLEGDYISSGGEKYITIGNFDDTTSLDTINVPSPLTGGLLAYYYIDDVSVTNVTGIDGSEIYFSFNIFPNPANDKIIIETHQPNGYVKLYSITGNLIKQVVINSSRTEIDIQNLASGVYYLQMGSSTQKLVIQH
jgi:hypothetical protein